MDSTVKAKILIVDDSPINITALVEILETEYDIFVATNGGDALKIAEKQKPDLILLDIVMPEIDGFEICKKLKSDESTSSIPVIFVTGSISEHDETEGFDIGAVDYINKPVRKAIVKARVRSHLETKRQRDMLENLTKIDGLTGIPNRRNFDEVLLSKWRCAQKSETHLSIAMIDIDHFKQYNDTYGHATGDSCLRKVAQALIGSCKRPGDFVARYGGEEFAVILSETDKNAALVVLERMKENIKSLLIEHSSSNVSNYITLSIGLASMVPIKDFSPDSLVEKADQILYQAKKNGRNRIEVAYK